MRAIVLALMCCLAAVGAAGRAAEAAAARATPDIRLATIAVAAAPAGATPGPAVPIAGPEAVGKPARHVPIARGRGILVLEGGGAPAAEATARIVAAAGPSPVLCIIQTAMHGLEQERNRFARQRGLRIETFDFGPDEPASAADLARLSTCTGYYFNGGDPERLSHTFLPGGQSSPALQIIRNRYLGQGAVVSGSSAGAMIVGRLTLCECGAGSSRTALLEGRLFEAPGFGLVDPAVLVDAHFFARSLLGRHVWEMARRGFRTGVGIDERTAVVVPGDGGPWEVIGSRTVALIRAPANPSAEDLRGFTISLLAPGDRFDPLTGAVQVARSRRPVPARANPSGTPPQANDIFAPGRIQRLILQLGAGRATAATGQAADGRIAVTFRRTAATRAFRDNAGTTVLNLGLDIEVRR